MLNKKLNLAMLIMLVFGWATITMTSCKEASTSENMEEMTEEVEEAVGEVGDAMEKAGDQLSEAKTDMEKAMNPSVYNLTEVDSQPLFSVSCKEDKNPSKCSEDKLFAFIKKNAKFPKRAQLNGASSLEQVLVVIEKDGSVSNVKYVASSNEEECKGCQQAAADVVGMMENWVPAMKDGNPVAVKMTIPIKFNS